MKRAVVNLMGIMVLGGVLISAHAQQLFSERQLIPEELYPRQFENLDNAYLELWGHWTDPIEIESKSMSVRDVSEGREAIFQGNVKVNRSDTSVTCDKLVMLVAANRRYFTASGNVKIDGKKFGGWYRGKTYRFFLQDERDRLFP